MVSQNVPTIIEGGTFTDDRGHLHFFNSFDLSPIQRFYIIEHTDTSIVRAWQGHQYESKWFHVISGAFKIVLVKPDNWIEPSEYLIPEEYLLRGSDKKILFVPNGYASGLQAISENSKVLVYSNFTLEESLQEKVRFDRDKWYNWNRNEK